jgi:hypothetical protein
MSRGERRSQSSRNCRFRNDFTAVHWHPSAHCMLLELPARWCVQSKRLPTISLYDQMIGGRGRSYAYTEVDLNRREELQLLIVNDSKPRSDP